MNIDQAKKELPRLFGTALANEMVLEKRNGVCSVLSKEPAGEKRDGKYNYLKDGRQVYGAGPSWLAALRQAAKPHVDAKRAQDAQDRAEVQKEQNEFADFLREKLMPEFEAWKAAKSVPAPAESQASNP